MEVVGFTCVVCQQDQVLEHLYSAYGVSSDQHAIEAVQLPRSLVQWFCRLCSEFLGSGAALPLQVAN